jgi:large repetitive protein
MLGLGINLWRPALSGGVAGPAIALTSASIAEDAIVGDAVGTLSVTNGSGVYTFTITADPDTKFAIDGSALELGATVDYETATTHSVTIEADNGVDPPISRTFTIYVTNVFEEPNLVALTLSASTIVEASAEDTVVGAIVGQTSGSTLSLTGTAGDRFKISAGNVVAGATATDYAAATSHDITIRETLADSANSPRETTLTITVTQAAVGPTGSGIQLETGDFLLAETGDYLIQEAA